MNYADLSVIAITETIPGVFKRRPGMIAVQERKLLYSLARDYVLNRIREKQPWLAPQNGKFCQQFNRVTGSKGIHR